MVNFYSTLKPKTILKRTIEIVIMENVIISSNKVTISLSKRVILIDWLILINIIIKTAPLKISPKVVEIAVYKVCLRLIVEKL